MNFNKWLIVAGLAIFVLILMSGASSSGGPADDSYPAQLRAEKLVTTMLKSPASAKFSDESATRSGAAWIVKGSVDSQNGFGAMIRSHFSCEVERESEHVWKPSKPCEIF